MKLRVPEIVKKMMASLAPMQKLVLISLAAWVTHIILRVLLLFRNNPYGFPFVSKPDWFIFHAVCIDFMWIVNALVVFLVISAIAIKITDALKSDKAKSVIQKTLTVLYAVFHGAILFLTLLDNETQRFLGGHLTFGLVDTYKDTSSIVVFYDYVANDLSVPYLQFVVLLLMHYLICRKRGLTVMYDNKFNFIILAVMSTISFFIPFLYPYMIVRIVIAFIIGIITLAGMYKIKKAYF